MGVDKVLESVEVKRTKGGFSSRKQGKLNLELLNFDP